MRKRAQTVVKDNWLPRDISMRTKGMALPVKNSNGTLETTTRRGQKGSASAAAASAASRAARAAHASEAGGAAAALTAHVKAPPLDTSAGDALTAADALTTAADAAAHLPPHNLPSDQAPSECKGLAPPPEFAGTSGVGDGCSAPVDPSSDRTVAEEEGGAAVAAVPLPISQGPGPGQGPGPCLATAAAPDAKSSQEAGTRTNTSTSTARAQIAAAPSTSPRRVGAGINTKRGRQGACAARRVGANELTSVVTSVVSVVAHVLTVALPRLSSLCVSVCVCMCLYILCEPAPSRGVPSRTRAV